MRVELKTLHRLPKVVKVDVVVEGHVQFVFLLWKRELLLCFVALWSALVAGVKRGLNRSKRPVRVLGATPRILRQANA